jgi:hypothetical protein
MKEYQLEMVVSLDPDKKDEFLTRLIALVEDLAGQLGGGLVELPENDEAGNGQP